MTQINVQIKGLAEFQAALKRYPRAASTQFHKAIKKSINDIMKDSMMMTPVKTGRLMNSHRQKLVGKTRGEVGVHTDYAIYVHDGTYKMRSRPFLSASVEDNQEKVEKNFKDALDKTMQIVANLARARSMKR